MVNCGEDGNVVVLICVGEIWRKWRWRWRKCWWWIMVVIVWWHDDVDDLLYMMVMLCDVLIMEMVVLCDWRYIKVWLCVCEVEEGRELEKMENTALLLRCFLVFGYWVCVSFGSHPRSNSCSDLYRIMILV
jgi:hypothetical protein